MVMEIPSARPLPFCVRERSVNPLTPGRLEWKFIKVVFKLTLVIDGWGISNEIALGWMSLHLTLDESTLVQVMARCRQATSHYLNQCWPCSISQTGITRPKWVQHNHCRLPNISSRLYSCQPNPVYQRQVGRQPIALFVVGGFEFSWW